jgi:molybdopterin-guanine dinucleotide biosynthesis protein
MKKVKVIIGKRNSGKSTIANAIACSLEDEKKVFISVSNLKGSDLLNRFCTDKTKVVVIEGLQKHHDIFSFIVASIEGLICNRRNQDDLVIYPEIIIVCEEEITREFLLELGASTVRRIEIIETIS